jgi:hypothetical protein
MARRKGSPKIPADTLARARAQAALNPVPKEQPPAPNTPTAEAAPVSAAPVSTRRRLEEKRERERKKAELDSETIKEMLRHPTKFPTADDLKRDYAHVTRDLSSMFLLTAGLMALMFLLAAVAPGL